jgi:single-strand DNA-binding protein
MVGTLGRDAEMRYTPSGSAILSFSIANSTGYGDKKKDTWYRVAIYGKQAESKIKDYLLKGQQVFVSGEFSPNEYQAKDGTVKVSYEISSNFVELVGSRKEPVQTKHNEQKANGYAPKASDYDDYSDQIPF